MKKLLQLAIVALVVCAFSAPLFADDSTVKVINQSKWEIHHIFLSPADTDEWGPDQLEDAVLAKGQSLTLTDVPCDHYDIKVVDEDADECVIEKIELCGHQAFWKITDKDLLTCEGYK